MAGKIHWDIRRERNISEEIRASFLARQQTQQIPFPESDFRLLDEILCSLKNRENRYLRPTRNNNSSFVTERKTPSPIIRLVTWVKFEFRGKSKIKEDLEALRSHNKHLQQRFLSQLDLHLEPLQQNKTGTPSASIPTSNVLPNPQHLDLDTLTSSHSRSSIRSDAVAEYGETLSESTTSNIPPIGSPAASITHTGAEFGTPSDLREINESINLNARTPTPCTPLKFGTSCRIDPADSDGGFDLQSLRLVPSEERWDNYSRNSHVLQVITTNRNRQTLGNWTGLAHPTRKASLGICKPWLSSLPITSTNRLQQQQDRQDDLD